VNGKDKNKPLYCGLRNFLGEKDLVISLYTQKCQFNCNFCALRKKSSDKPIPLDSQKKQIDHIFKKYHSELNKVERISIGNEGSILDCGRVPFELLEYLSGKSKKMIKLKTISFETRPEYINLEALKKIKKTFPKTIDCTIGFETKDKKIRQKLNKHFSEKSLKKAMEALSKIGGTLTAYILLKPDLSMSDQDAIKEALASTSYLLELTKQKKVPLTIYLNPLYIPTGTPLCKEAKENSYSPPSACSLVKFLEKEIEINPKLKIYIGLYSENLAKNKGEFLCPRKKGSEIRETLKKFNKTQYRDLIKSIVCQKCDLYARI